MTDLALNAIDAAVLGLLVIAAWMGFRAGLVATLYSLASWVLATAAAIAFAGPVSGLVETFARLPKPVATSVAFVAVIVLVEALFSITGYLAIRPIVGLIRRSAISGADRALGVIPAIARSVFIVAVAILAIEALPVASEVKAAVETSRSGRIVGEQVSAVQPQISALTSQLGGSPLLVTKIGEDETEKLDLPDVLAIEPDPVAERQLYDLVNEERGKVRLAILACRDQLLEGR